MEAPNSKGIEYTGFDKALLHFKIGTVQEHIPGWCPIQ